MMPMTRQDIEILLDSPSQKDFVVSAYADLRVKDGFHRYVDTTLKNQEKALNQALTNAAARHTIAADLEAIRNAVAKANPSAQGMAVFSGSCRQLFHVVPLDFHVENYLVIDEDPYVLPLLEHWYGHPNYLVAVVDSHQLHLYEAHAGLAEEIGGLKRHIDHDIQRDKPGFTYKKRFSQTRHEHLQELTDDNFLKEAAATIADHWKTGGFHGLILLGQAPVTAAIRKLLPSKDLDQAVVEQAAQSLDQVSTEAVREHVDRVLDRWRHDQQTRLRAELAERRKRKHLVANGAVEVLDALQQGRATDVVLGTNRHLAGARCTSCGYRFGTPVGVCSYCQAPTRNVNAVQEILRMSLRHHVSVHLVDQNGPTTTTTEKTRDPLEAEGGVAALLRAEANWAPDAATARASQGH